MTSKDSPRYRIQAVAQRTGIPAATLRAWERRYGIPRPVRTDTAYRTYSERDVELVEELRRLCGTGLSPAEAANLLKETPPPPRGTESNTDVALWERPPHSAQPNVTNIHEAVVARLVAAVRLMNISSIDSELLHARSLGSSLQIFENVLRPALETVGQLWHDGEISIGHEHLATEMITATARDLLRLSQPPSSDRLALLACFADEVHTASLYGIGLRMAGWGCRVAVLGALTPPSALGPAVKRLSPAVVGLSVTITPSPARARELIEGYASACGEVPWIVGGQAAPSLSSLVAEFGGMVAPSNEDGVHQLFERVIGPTAHAKRG